MTSFSDPLRQQFLDEANRRHASLSSELGAINLGTSKYSNTSDASSWDHIFNVLGKPEEWLTKTIGGIFSADPKYDFGYGRVGDQVSFADLFSDGFEAVGAGNVDPLVPALLGLGAAIVNPFDPLNKLKIAGLTAKGLAFKHVDELRKIPKLVEESADGLVQVSKLHVQRNSLAAAKRAKEAADMGDAAAARTAQAAFRQLDKANTNIDDINRVLREAHKAGIKAEDIRLADSLAEQARLGQRRLVGFSHPLSLEHMRFFGPGDRIMDEASNSFYTMGVVPGTSSYGSAMDTAVFTGVEAAKEVGRKIVQGGASILNQPKLGGWNFIPENQRHIVDKLDAALGDQNLKFEEFINRIRDVYRALSEQGLLDEKSLSAINGVYVDWLKARGRPFGSAEKAVLDEIASKYSDDILANARAKVRRMSRDDIAAKAVDDRWNTLDRNDVRPLDDFTPQDEEAVHQIRATWAGRPRTRLGAQQVVNEGRYVVFSGSIPKGVKADDIAGIEGLPEFYWSRDRAGRPFYAAKKPPRMKKGLSPYISTQETGEAVTVRHLESLEILAAQLAQKNIAVRNLHLDDLLFGENGEVLLLNLNKLAPAKTTKDAVLVSHISVDEFGRKFVGNYDTSSTLTFLHSPSQAKEAARYAKRRQAWRQGQAPNEKGRLADIPAQEGQTARVSAPHLLHQAFNAEAHRRFLYGAQDGSDEFFKVFGEDGRAFGVMNGVSRELDVIDNALSKGLTPDLAPITVARDSFGNIHIVEGRDRLTAAVIRGVDSIPVKLSDMFYDELDAGRVLSTRSERADVLFYDNVEELAAFELHAANPEMIDLVSPDYKLLTEEGFNASLTQKDFRYVGPDGAPVPPKEDIFRKSAEFVRARKAGAKVNEDSLLTVENALWNMHDNGDMARYLLATQLSEAKSLEEVRDIFRQLLGSDNIFDPNVGVQRHTDMANALVTQSQEYLQQTNSRGILTSRDLDTGNIGFEGIVSWLDEQGVIHYHNPRATKEQVAQYAKMHLEQSMGLDMLVPHSPLVAHGSDGPLQTRIGDWLSPDEMGFDDTIPFARKMNVSQKKIDLLKKEGIIFGDDANRDTLKLDSTGRLLVYNPGLSSTSHRPTFNKPNHAVFITESGKFFVSIKNDVSTSNVSHMMRKIFGEGYIPRGEFGFIDSDNVLLSYPAVDIDTLSPRNIRRLESRLRFVAKTLIDAGYAPGLKVTVRTPYDAQVWKSFFKSPTLGEMADKRWKLDIPSTHIGMPLDTVIDNTTFHAVYARPRMGKDTPLASIAKLIKDENDELLRLEMEAMLPVSFTGNYLARELTPQAQEVLGLLNEKALNQLTRDDKSLNLLKSFMRERVISDLTPQQINDLFREANKALGGGADVVSVEEALYKAYNEIITQSDAQIITNLARMFDEAGVDASSGFFIEDPLYAAVSRGRKSLEARKTQTVVETLKEELGVWEGTADELVDLETLAGKKDIKAVTDARRRTERAAKTVQQLEKDGLASSEEYGKAAKKLEAAQKAEAEAVARQNELQQRLIDAHGPLANDATLDTSYVYLTQADARKLFYAGKLGAEDLATGLDNGLVAVPRQVITTRSIGDAKVYVFPKESLALVERYFGAARKSTGHARALLDMFDGFMNAWRTWTLFPIPAYHARNFVSNLFLGWLSGYGTVQSYNNSLRLLRTIRNHNLGKLTYDQVVQVLKDTKYYNAFGVEVSALDLHAEAVRHGVFAGGLHYNEYALSARDPEKLADFKRELDRLGVLPSGELQSSIVTDNRLLRTGKKVAEGIENEFRLSVFMDAWQREGNFEDAAKVVKQTFYDYRNLNQFERSVMRRVLPFYSWVRFNTPRMLETLATKPIIHYRLQKFTQDWERTAVGGPVNEDELPLWLKDRFGIVVDKADDGTYVVRALDTLIPAFEVYGMFRSEGYADFFKNSLVNGVTPVLKTPIEALWNHSSYTNQEIERAPGEPAKGYLYSQLGATRRATYNGPLGILNLVFNEQVTGLARLPDTIIKYLDQFLDEREYKKYSPKYHAALVDLALGKSYAVDPVATTQRLQADYERNVSRFENLVEWARDNNDEVSAEFYATQLNRLRLEKSPR